jgi:hypothetical protein
MKISKDKKYKTRLGVNVIIYKIWEEQNKIHGAAVDTKNNLICTLEWDLEGRVWQTTESGNDLMEISPYADFKIDDKVLVWDDGQIEPYKYHFAGISKNGNPLTWDDGRTSFTETKFTSEWKNCAKYEENNDNE